jgi:hypothetical protein
MTNLTKLGVLGIIISLSACSPTGGVALSTGGNPAVGGAGNSGAQGGVTALGGSTPIIQLGGQSGTAGTTGSKACGSAAVCTSTSCGKIVDPCGALIDCGYTNCAQRLCGTATPNECTPCTPVAVDCVAGKYCGPVLDNCFNVVSCPATCADPAECCGCGGVASVCGGTNPDGGLSGSSHLGVTCIAGSKGCLCDDAGGCAAGLTCTTQSAPNPSLCCNGTDCTAAGTNIGGTCTGTGIATCTPGITVPTATSTLDTCGYATSGFNESTILCGIYATGGGKDPAQIQAYFNDEHAMTLGCATAALPVSAMPSNPGAVRYPQLGDPSCVDTAKRPMRPTLFITDITYDPNCKAGDQQAGGTAYDAIAVFGTWKSATESATSVGTPVSGDPTPMNYWTLGTGADPIPASVSAQCPCSGPGNLCPGSGKTGKGYGMEVKYEAGLISGHSYRLQIMGHDGDQTQGADSGEACAIFCAGTGTCAPLTCADFPTGTCGPQPDGCGGTTPSCGTCCTPLTCADYPASAVGPQPDGCGGMTANCNYRP